MVLSFAAGLRAQTTAPSQTTGPKAAEELAEAARLEKDGYGFYAQGKYAEAEKAYRGSLQIRERALGAEHRDSLRCRANLAEALEAQRKYVAAEQEYRAVLPIMERVLGAESADVLHGRHCLAVVLYAQSKFAEGEKEFRAVIEIKQRVLGAENKSTLASRTIWPELWIRRANMRKRNRSTARR